MWGLDKLFSGVFFTKVLSMVFYSDFSKVFYLTLIVFLFSPYYFFYILVILFFVHFYITVSHTIKDYVFDVKLSYLTIYAALGVVLGLLKIFFESVFLV